MADLSKIRLNNIDYNFKDIAAREAIPNVIIFYENEENDLTCNYSFNDLYNIIDAGEPYIVIFNKSICYIYTYESDAITFRCEYSYFYNGEWNALFTDIIEITYHISDGITISSNTDEVELDNFAEIRRFNGSYYDSHLISSTLYCAIPCGSGSGFNVEGFVFTVKNTTTISSLTVKWYHSSYGSEQTSSGSFFNVNNVTNPSSITLSAGVYFCSHLYQTNARWVFYYVKLADLSDIPITAPVKSVNGQTGDVELDISEVLIINVATVNNPTTNAINTTTADKTYAEISTALAAGKTIYALYNNIYYPYTAHITNFNNMGNFYIFGSSNVAGSQVITQGIMCGNSAGWIYWTGTAIVGVTASYASEYSTENNNGLVAGRLWDPDYNNFDVDIVIPKNISEFTNDAGYLTSYTETDPTVPEWAKAATKPTYTAAEVGALPDTTVIPDISGKVDKAGDTMTGDLQFANDKGIILSYNDNTDKLELIGSGSNYRIASFEYSTELRNIKLPSVDTAAANKQYVDNQTAFVKTTAGSNNTEYNLIGTASSNANTSAVNVFNPGSISFAKTTNEGRLTLGSNSLPGKIRLYSNVANATGYTDLVSGASSTNERTITFPDASGTVALTSDVPSVPSWAMQSSKPSYAFSELTSHPTTINDYGITDAYTKTEVDGLVSGVLHYKGAKANTSALPSSGNAIGDVWHITADGSEWAWDGTEWQELGSTIDLSGYLQTGDIAAWAKASTKPSYTASEVGALPSTTTYVSSFNGESGAITYIAPVTSVNGQTGAVTLDVDKWNGVTWNKTIVSESDRATVRVPLVTEASSTTAYLMTATYSPSAGAIARYNANSYLISTTPSANDNSTKVATTAYVDAAIPSVTQTLASGTAIGAVGGTTLYAPAAYDDTALAARVTALENIPWVTYYTGSSTPSNSQGSNGDIYLQTD